jgi:methylase of polypeptide subunit release factors
VISLEKQILAILEQVNEKLDNFGAKLDEHGEILKEHGEILKEHGKILIEHGEILKEHGKILKEHGEILKEHSFILGALRNGQEVLKAEISEMRLQNAKEFGEIKSQLTTHEDSIEILKGDSWNNRSSILRVQKTLGLS